MNGHSKELSSDAQSQLIALRGRMYVGKVPAVRRGKLVRGTADGASRSAVISVPRGSPAEATWRRP